MADLIENLFNASSRIKAFIEKKRANRKWNNLQKMGLKIGKDVYMPLETWIDTSHCYLISIGNKVRFGPHCAILAHDAFMNAELDVSKIGRVTIHDGCTIGFGSLILPGVEIGERSIVAACSVVTRSVPPGSIVAGNPAKVIGKTESYYKFHQALSGRLPQFPYEKYGTHALSEVDREDLLAQLGPSGHAVGYIVGGYSGLEESHEYFSGQD